MIAIHAKHGHKFIHHRDSKLFSKEYECKYRSYTLVHGLILPDTCQEVNELVFEGSQRPSILLPSQIDLRYPYKMSPDLCLTLRASFLKTSDRREVIDSSYVCSEPFKITCEVYV